MNYAYAYSYMNLDRTLVQLTVFTFSKKRLSINFKKRMFTHLFYFMTPMSLNLQVRLRLRTVYI